MKVQLLGTAGGDFLRVDDLKDNFAYLPRVRELGGNNLRRPAQAMIYPDILVDFYDAAQLGAFGIPRDQIKHLFITHAHWDHFQPLRILEFAQSLSHQLQVYGNRTVIDALRFADTYDFDRTTGRFLERDKKTDINLHVLELDQSYEVGHTEISAVHANHGIDKSENMIMDLECLNYVFQRDGKSVFYGLDSSYPFPLTVQFLKKFRFDVAVFDATFGQWPIDAVKSGHHNLPMVVETVQELRDEGIIEDSTVLAASHIALAEVKPHDELVEDFSEHRIILAYDGWSIEV